MNKLTVLFIRNVVSLLVANGVLIVLMGGNVMAQEPSAENELKAMRVNLMTDEVSEDPTPKFTQKGVDESIKGKKRMDFYLQDSYGNDEKNQLILQQKKELIIREMERITFTESENEVIVVHLNDENSIGDWLVFMTEAADIGIRRYAYSQVNDALYFLGNEKLRK